MLREALLNALAHRDYGLRGATVDVTIWDDRIEIRSPGSLPGPITLENMRVEHYSRNRKLIGCLKALGLVLEYGEGIDRMFDGDGGASHGPTAHRGNSSLSVARSLPSGARSLGGWSPAERELGQSGVSSQLQDDRLAPSRAR